MKLNLIVLVSGSLLILALAVFASLYPGNNTPVVVQTNSSSQAYNASLLVYGDVDAGLYNCFDTDNGVNPQTGGRLTWFDGGVPYTYDETCNGTHVVETMCGQNILIGPTSSNMNPAPGYVIAVDIDCANILYTTCALDSNGIGHCI